MKVFLSSTAVDLVAYRQVPIMRKDRHPGGDWSRANLHSVQQGG